MNRRLLIPVIAFCLLSSTPGFSADQTYPPLDRWMTTPTAPNAPNLLSPMAVSTPPTLEAARQAERVAEKARETGAAQYASYAVLSNEVYPKVAGQPTFGSLPADIVPIPPFTSDKPDGFHAETFERYANGKLVEVIVSFRGTDTKLGSAENKKDKDNWLGGQQYRDAREYANEMRSKYPNTKFTLTGHSLGGGLAQWAAIQLPTNNAAPVEAVVFNTSPLPANPESDPRRAQLVGPGAALFYVGPQYNNPIIGISEHGEKLEIFRDLLGPQGTQVDFSQGSPEDQHSMYILAAGLVKEAVKDPAQTKNMEQINARLSASAPSTLTAAKALPTTKVLPATKPHYVEVDNRSSTGRPKVIDTTTNYFAVATVFSPSSGSAHLLTATGFEMRRDVSNTSASYDSGTGYSGSIGTASVVDQGSDASGGNLNWGRWSGAGSTNVAAGITYTGQNFHYVYGSAPTNIPSSGSVTYNPVGGTNPTSSGGTNVAAGTAGTFNGGTIGVNFATRAVTVSNLNFTVSTATFNMGGSSTYNSNALFSGSLTGTCTGAACSGAVSGNHIGTLTGPAAAGIALGYQAHTTGTGMVVGAQGFKR